MLAWLRFGAKYVVWPALAAVVVGAVLVFAFPSALHLKLGSSQGVNKATSGRFDLMDGGLKLARAKPLLGWGSGSFQDEYRRHEHASGREATSASHTIPITVAAEQGMLGLAAYIALLVLAFARLLRGARGSPVRAAIAAGFFALVLHTWLYAAFLEDPVTWTLLALGSALGHARAGGRRGGRGRGGLAQRAPQGARGRGPPGLVSRFPRGVERAALALALAVAVLVWLVTRTYPNYDSYFHLIWGREVVHGTMPSFEAYAAPTQHPLYVALGGVLGLIFGESADRVLVLVCLLSHALLVIGTYRLGAAVFGRWSGALAALFVAASASFLLYAARGYVDSPFLALVVWAAVWEAEDRSRRPPASPACCASMPRRAAAPRRRGCSPGSRVAWWLAASQPPRAH